MMSKDPWKQILLALGWAATTSVSAQSLPEGNVGIASKYSGDVGIRSDAAVLFAEDFEGYDSASQLTSSGNWVNYYGNVSIDATNHFAGAKSLRIRMPQSATEVSGAIVRNVAPQDKLHIRFYARYQPTYAGITSAHSVVFFKANYPGPGTKPNGSNFFAVMVENSRYRGEAEPGQTNAYVYHPEQDDNYGEHWYPSGFTSN